jgi:hypothetical protein
VDCANGEIAIGAHADQPIILTDRQDADIFFRDLHRGSP